LLCSNKPPDAPPKDIFDDYDGDGASDNESESVMETGENGSDSEDGGKDEEDDDDDYDDDEDEEDKDSDLNSSQDDSEILAAWKVIGCKTILDITETYPNIEAKAVFEEPFFSQNTLESFYKILRYHINLARQLEKSELFLSLKNTQARLVKEGLPNWEARLIVLDKRKHAIRSTLNDAMTVESEDSDSDDEDGVEEKKEVIVTGGFPQRQN